jgi:hypothetical protein
LVISGPLTIRSKDNSGAMENENLIEQDLQSFKPTRVSRESRSIYTNARYSSTSASPANLTSNP